MDTIITRDVSTPRLGFGTFRMPDGGYQPVVESALALGYRHLDTAAMYENEDTVGAAIAASKVARGELFVTTKVWRAARDERFDSPRFRHRHREAEARLRRSLHDPRPSKDMDMAVVMET
jgi:2,5-diketo-D-gluconate reductase B